MKADKPVSLDQWDDARERMRLAKEDGATTRTRLIADLMTLESYLWSGQSSEAIAAGDRFIDDYSTMTAAYRKEIATAYVALSRVAKQLGNYEECILFAQSVLEMYPEETEMWPEMDHLQRACYDLVEGLYYLGQLKEGDAKLAEFSKRFPDSPYLRAIELGKKAKLYERRQSQSRGSR